MNNLPVSFPLLLEQLPALSKSLKEFSQASKTPSQEDFSNHTLTDSIHIFDNIQEKQLDLLQVLWSCRGARYALGKNLEDLYKDREDETTLESNRRLLDLARELDGCFWEIHQLVLAPQYHAEEWHLTTSAKVISLPWINADTIRRRIMLLLRASLERFFIKLEYTVGFVPHHYRYITSVCYWIYAVVAGFVRQSVSWLLFLQNRRTHQILLSLSRALLRSMPALVCECRVAEHPRRSKPLSIPPRSPWASHSHSQFLAPAILPAIIALAGTMYFGRLPPWRGRAGYIGGGNLIWLPLMMHEKRCEYKTASKRRYQNRKSI